MMKKLSHVDETGRAKMVDVGGKVPLSRQACARGRILLSGEAVQALRENRITKGDVLTVAQVAGISAAKRTSDLIPLCHPLSLNFVDIQLSCQDDGVTATSDVRCIGPTGAEMEALMAVSVALLTVYDMCKAIDKNMKITETVLLEKTKNKLTCARNFSGRA